MAEERSEDQAKPWGPRLAEIVSEEGCHVPPTKPLGAACLRGKRRCGANGVETMAEERSAYGEMRMRMVRVWNASTPLMFRALAITAAAFSVAVHDSHAQASRGKPSAPSPSPQTVELEYFHGLRGASGNLRSGMVTRAGRPNLVFLEDRNRVLFIKEPSRICVRVVNPNPANYSYRLTEKRLVVADDSLDLGVFRLLNLKDLVTPSPPSASFSGDKNADSPFSSDSALNEVLGRYQEVYDQYSQLMAIARDADVVQSLASLDEQSSRDGYRAAVQRLYQLVESKSGLFDPRLIELFRSDSSALVANREKQADAHQRAILGAGIIALVEKAILIRDVVQERLGNDEIVRACTGVLAAGDFEVSFAVAALDVPASSPIRAIGDESEVALSVKVSRPDAPFRLTPVFLASVSFSAIPAFGVRDGRLAELDQRERTAFAAGALLSADLARFGDEKSVKVGLGVGVGTDGGAGVVSSMLVAALVSFRNQLTVGLGIGPTRFPVSVRGFAVGGELGPNVESIEKLLVRDFRSSYHLIVAWPGFSVR